jgi:signal transduction histidine kinase
MSERSFGGFPMHAAAVAADIPSSEPVALARRLHDTVAQRLAGLSYLLAHGDDPTADTLLRCRAEVNAALGELREALASVTAGRRDGDDRAELETQLRAVRERFPDARVMVDLTGVLEAQPSGLVRGFVAEALRNVCKHASPRVVTVAVQDDGDLLSVVVHNDGVRTCAGPSCGLGRRLLEVEASLCGGLVESTPLGGEEWRQRLLLPAVAQRAD